MNANLIKIKINLIEIKNYHFHSIFSDRQLLKFFFFLYFSLIFIEIFQLFKNENDKIFFSVISLDSSQFFYFCNSTIEDFFLPIFFGFVVH